MCGAPVVAGDLNLSVSTWQTSSARLVLHGFFLKGCSTDLLLHFHEVGRLASDVIKKKKKGQKSMRKKLRYPDF